MTVFSIHHLPPEVLGTVFEWCSVQLFHRPDPTVAPLLLTRISRHWRNVALSTPSLWSSLSLDLNPPNKRLPLLQTWLARSACIPLDLDLGYYDRAADAQIDALLEILRPHAHQLRSLGIFFHSRGIIQIARWSLPRLQCVDFGWVVGTEPTGAEVMPLFLNAPALRELHANGDDIYPLLAAPLFPWAQLTSLECTAYSVYASLEVLRLATSLEHCVLSGQRHLSTTLPIAEVLLRPNLRSLDMLGSWDGVELLSRVSLPGLQELQFTAGPDAQLTSIKCHSIRKLQLTFHGPDDAQLMQYLRSLTSLVDLQVNGLNKPLLLALFSALETDENLLPRLQTLYVEFNQSDRGLYPSIIKMLVRGKSFRPLKAATFEFLFAVATPGQRGQAAIAALREEGVDVRFLAANVRGKSAWSKSIVLVST
ncbi:hypothetical protein FB45DRAFT_905509, partial [Roridomyces roridus]